MTLIPFLNDPPEVPGIEQLDLRLAMDAADLLDSLGRIEHIDTDDQFQIANSLLVAGTAMLKKWREHYSPIKKGIDNLKRLVLDKEKSDTTELAVGVEKLKSLIADYHTRMEEARRLQLSGTTVVVGFDPGDEIDAALAAPSMPTVEGVAMRTYYSTEITDLLAFISWAVQDEVRAVDFLLPNTTKLNDWARAQKDHFRVPGVTLVKTKRPASTGRAVGGAR